MQIFDCAGGWHPNSHAVQGLTAYLYIFLLILVSQHAQDKMLLQSNLFEGEQY